MKARGFGVALGGGVTRVRTVWDEAKVFAIVNTIPAQAHTAAAVVAAEAAAARVGHSGPLAADLRIPKPQGQFRSVIGSSLPYARIEHYGGPIKARNTDNYGRQLLYIRPGDIKATVSEVFHKAKRWGDPAIEVYVALMPQEFRRMFPR